ncbi:universal stress protein [Paraburkholderia ultramafica]|uniref:universal stress protein n=1 Tax=Paraburkholderia ultramafica TaxID=1544867 RepID=UPI001582F88A
MFHDLLVPLDGTAQGDHVVKLAARAAIASQSRLHVLCVVDPAYLTSPEDVRGTEPDGLSYPPANEQSARAVQIISAAVEVLKRKGFNATGYLSGGEASDAIIEHANRLHADLIVMGHRHLSRLRRLSDPSTAGKVIERAPCPVLLETSWSN